MKNKYQFAIVFPFIASALIACSKVDVEAEVRNLINAECKVDKISERKDVSMTEAKAAIDEFSKVGEDVKNKLKTQDQKDEFLIYYSAIRQQEAKCTNPIFNRDKLEAAKLYLKSQKQ